MLNPIAFASSLTILTAVLYLGLSLLALVSRDAFRFLFNAQFFGADVASLLPRELSSAVVIGTLITVVAGVWVVAYAWAWLYNRLAR